MRVQFIELHEQPWFPSTIRDEITDAMEFGLRLLNVYAPVVPILQTVLCSTGSLEATPNAFAGNDALPLILRQRHVHVQNPMHRRDAGAMSANPLIPTVNGTASMCSMRFGSLRL